MQVLRTPTHLVIVMEYTAAGELFDGICTAGRFSEDEVRTYSVEPNTVMNFPFFSNTLTNGYLVGLMNLNIKISSFIIELLCMNQLLIFMMPFFQSSITGRCHSFISFMKSIFAFGKYPLLPFYSFVSFW